jgi:hypothetical protein
MNKTTQTQRGAMSEFVRSVPRGMPAAEVVRLAAQSGLALTAANVYSARAYKPGLPAGGVTRLPTPPPAIEVEFQRLAVRLGYERAFELVTGLLDRVAIATNG